MMAIEVLFNSYNLNKINVVLKGDKNFGIVTILIDFFPKMVIIPIKIIIHLIKVLISRN